ncbi:MAG: type II/IV secretion system protein [Desulfobacteraceae bacterium]|nr:type II/IV secretion system protein [Desulfobacteraceae bacterium]MBC2754526.1 type II/IV secretion system protein [Desulfobacteraceae bacterium]MBC2763809.1 type II/IV secretion system protein [ANME-2 cluster archaeon]
MTNDNGHPFSDKSVCISLVSHGLITKEHALEIFEKKEKVRANIEKKKDRRSEKMPTGVRIINPTTIVDVIISFKFSRADKQDVELDEDAIFKVLAREWDKPYKKIDPLKLDLNLVTTTIPRSFAMKHLVLPIEVENGYLVIATSNPFNSEVFEDIGRVSLMPVKTVVTSKSDIIRLIDEFFGFKRSIVEAETQFSGPSVDLGNLEQYVRLKSPDELPSNDHHIVNAVNHLFIYAFDQRASDIHIEPKRDISLIRMRIDGVLHTVYRLPKKVHSPMVSRIKNMSRLDMAEKRRPQDGRIKTAKGSVEVEIRISTVPVAFGEKVVMRVMDPDILFQDLDQLGFTPPDLERYNDMVNRPNGLVLVCGPTGSGKSTTLYSTLRRLSTPEINTTTIEDPIEMVHEEFNQIAVQPAVNITFATIMRNILRQDPDIIMVGELRDIETAQNAVQAALTGHLVLSTLHTNDAPSSIVRLLDIGIPYFLVQATLTGIISQRLVRKICPKCVESYKIDVSQLRNSGLDIKKDGQIELYQGKGCSKCRGTGYFGRTAIYEALPYSKILRNLTTQKTDLASLREAAFKENLVTLRENAIKKLLDGITTYEEVMRVTWESD